MTSSQIFTQVCGGLSMCPGILCPTVNVYGFLLVGSEHFSYSQAPWISCSHCARGFLGWRFDRHSILQAWKKRSERSVDSFSGKVSAPVLGNPEGLADLGSGLPLQPLALDLRCCRSRLPGVQGGWAPVLNEDRSEHRYFTDFSADCPPPPRPPCPRSVL